jgi:hypothetical protein
MGFGKKLMALCGLSILVQYDEAGKSHCIVSLFFDWANILLIGSGVLLLLYPRVSFIIHLLK